MPGHAARRQVIAEVLVPRGVRAGTNAGHRRQWSVLNCLDLKSDGPHLGFREKGRRSETAPIWDSSEVFETSAIGGQVWF